MSTIVAVRKGNQVCIAADSLTSFGDTRLAAGYDAAYDKIHSYGDNYLGVVGSAAHLQVFQSIFAQGAEYDLSTRAAIFETFRSLHPKEDEEDAYESSRIDALIINPKGLFGVYSLREVFEYTRYWAIGSGAEYALGAMHALYDRLDSAEEIARAGVEAGAEFNNASSLPMSLYTVTLSEA